MELSKSELKRIRERTEVLSVLGSVRLRAAVMLTQTDDPETKAQIQSILDGINTEIKKVQFM